MMQAPCTRFPQPVSCSICKKQFKYVHEHIEHMTTVHQMKASFRCTTCGVIFPTKAAVEAHLATHAGNGQPVSSASSTPSGIDIEEDEEEDGDDLMKEVYTCHCGKAYFLPESFAAHQKVCPSKSTDSPQPHNRSTHSSKPNLQSSSSSTGANVSAENSDTKSPNFSPASNDLGPSDIIIAPSDELIRRAYLVRNRVQCPRCLKIFGGKTPAVAYNNHRRNKHCPATQATVPYLKAKFNNKNKDQQPSPQAADVVPISAVATPTTPSESGTKLPDSQAQVRYYCKLCPNRDIKNRVSLGVHLTTYHGLPPVNISSHEGIVLRCQTCSQNFNSKYFYNMHRYECDLTSPYIGILEPDKTNSEPEEATVAETKNIISETDEDNSAHLPAPPPSIMPPPIQSISPAPISPQTSQPQHHGSHNSVPSHNSTPTSISNNSSVSPHIKVQPAFNNPPRGSAVSNAYFGSNYTCTLCHKKGFPGPNAVRIHQKYQCVKRPLVPPPKSPYPAPLTKPRSKSYSRPLKEESQLGEGASESRLAALLGSPNPVALNSHLKGELLNDINRIHDSGLLMCDDCGRGPYNSQYYLLEHKRQFCQVAKNNSSSSILHAVVSSPTGSSSPKSNETESALGQTPQANTSKINDTSNRSVPSCSSSYGNAIRSTPQKAKTISDHTDQHSTVSNGTHSKAQMVNNNNIGNSKTSSDFVNLTVPESVPPPDSDNMIECAECGFLELDILRFVRHRLKHLTEKPETSTTFTCEICKGKTVLNHVSRMRQHLHHHVKIYNALYRRDRFNANRRKRPNPFENDETPTTNNNNNNYDESDNDDDLVTCPYCRACRFENAFDLSNHIKTSCPFRFSCVRCGTPFPTKGSLVEHKETCLHGIEMRNPKTLISCHHCGLKLNSKQRLFYHEQACHKVYNADVSLRVEELIERASTCSICGLRAKSYIVKAKHEVKCLEMALDSLGIKCLRFDNVENNDTDSSIVNGGSIDQSTLTSTHLEEEEVDVGDMEEDVREAEDGDDEEPEDVTMEDIFIEENGAEKVNEKEMEEILRKQFGIEKKISILLERLTELPVKRSPVYENNSDNDEVSSDEEILVENFDKLDSLKQTFERLLRHLVAEEDVLREMLNGKSVDKALSSILSKMGTEPESSVPESDYLDQFRANIQTFLQLAIEKETLDQANQKTASIDEVIHNLLNVN